MNEQIADMDENSDWIELLGNIRREYNKLTLTEKALLEEIILDTIANIAER